MNGIQLLADETPPFLTQESKIVDAGFWVGRRDRVGGDVRVNRGDDLVGFGDQEKGIVEPDLDPCEVEWIIAQFDTLTSQVVWDAVAISLEGEGGSGSDLSGVTMKKGLTKLFGVGRADRGSLVLTKAFERRLAGLRVALGVVNDLNPGQQGLVELVKSSDGGVSEFREKIGLDKLEEALDLAAAFGIVSGTENALDAERSADRVELVGFIDTAPVDVDGERTAIAHNPPLETVLHSWELFVPIELGVRNQARVVVQEGKEKDLALAIWITGVREIRAVHRITLPQVAKVRTLEAAVGLGALLGEKSGGGDAAESELAAQGAGSNVRFGSRVGFVEGQHPDEGAGGTERLFALERFSAVERLGRDGATGAAVGARLGLEGFKPAFVEGSFPSPQAGHTDLATPGAWDVALGGGDASTQSLLGAVPFGVVLDQRQDQGIVG